MVFRIQPFNEQDVIQKKITQIHYGLYSSKKKFRARKIWPRRAFDLDESSLRTFSGCGVDQKTPPPSRSALPQQ